MGLRRTRRPACNSTTRPRWRKIHFVGKTLGLARLWCHHDLGAGIGVFLISTPPPWVAPGVEAAVGSSRNRICGSSAQARASARRCCSPPESTRAGAGHRRGPDPGQGEPHPLQTLRAAMPAVAGIEDMPNDRRSITGPLEHHACCRAAPPPHQYLGGGRLSSRA